MSYFHDSESHFDVARANLLSRLDLYIFAWNTQANVAISTFDVYHVPAYIHKAALKIVFSRKMLASR